MAALLGEPVTTVQSWKAAGRIPAARQPAVLAAARAVDAEITAEHIIFPLGIPDSADAVSHTVQDAA